MSTNLKLGNLVTPKGASLIFGAEATDDFLDIKTTNDETNNPYTIVIEEEDSEEIIPAEQISYFAGSATILAKAETAQEAFDQIDYQMRCQHLYANLTSINAFSTIAYFYEISRPLIRHIIDSSNPSAHVEYFYTDPLYTIGDLPEFDNAGGGLASPYYRLKASLRIDKNLLNWMNEYKIKTLYLMQKPATASYFLAWEKTSAPQPDMLPPLGIAIDILNEVQIGTPSLSSQIEGFVVDAVGGGGGLGGSFIVTYGETPINEVISAVEDNLNVTMLVEGLYAPLVEADTTNQKFVFSLDFPNTADPTAIGSRNIYTLDSNGYSFATYSNFSSDLYKTNDTPIDASKGYLRPIRVSTDLPTNNDGNAGDLWIVIGG